MTSNPVFFSDTNAEPAVSLEDLLAAGRRNDAKKRAGSRARKSEVAGAALVAAMIGAQFAEEAEASEDFARPAGDLDFLKAVRICNGHNALASALDDDGTNASLASAAHLGHTSAPTFAASMTATTAASRIVAQNPHHVTDDEPHSGVHSAGGQTSGGAATGGHVHGGSSGGTSGTTSGTTTGTTSGATSGTTTTTGGHTHSATTTTSGSALPHPTNPAMQKEHIALMNLVPISGATHVAIKDGSWFDPNTWANGKVPGDGAKVFIPEGVTVDYDGESAASIFTVRVDGKLDFATDVDTFMEVDTFVVAPTGTLTIGTEGNPVDPNVKAVISFADNGPINVAWDPMLLSRGLISHGTVDIHGAEKDAFLKVAVDPMKGDTTLTLEAPPQGWQVGDKIVLTGTHLVPNKSGGAHTPVTSVTQDEELVITAINGNVVTFDKPLQYDHEGPRADLKAYVSNMSRNIVFESEGGATTPTHERGHVMLMHSDNIVVKYAEFDELGRTDKSMRSFDVTSLTSVQSDSNIKGRYAFHIHRAGVSDQEHPAIVEGNSVWGSPGWGFVHHDSNAIFSNNAAYDVFGAAFVAETGNETGRWDHNIAIKSLGVDHITKDGADVSAFDLGRTGTGFWFQGRLVEAVGNVAASIPSGAGFTYFHRGADSNHIPIDPDNTNLPDALRYLDSVRTNAPNIAIFLNNESIATQTGLEIIKANPRQDHDLRSLIEGFLAWEVKTGVHLEYTGHYTIKDLDIVASDTKGIGNNYTVGVDLFNNVFDVVVNGANIEGFHTGVAMAKKGVAGLDFMNGKDQWDYIYIDVNVKGATYSFTNRTPGDKFLTAADLVEDRLSLTPGFLDTHLKMVNGVYNMLGEKLDSIGRTASYKVWDPDYINATELRGSIEQNGYWTTKDGRRVAMIEEYAADRATGDVIKVAYFVEIPSTYKLAAGGFTRTTPAYNGLLNENSKAPVAVDDFASVQQGKSVIIDVLANDMDPDGDKIVLDGLFSQHGHVVMNKDGTVTYFADPNFQGEDVFYYFVQDTNGDITKAQVTVTVDV
jgi:hypothetical protein